VQCSAPLDAADPDAILDCHTVATTADDNRHRAAAEKASL